MNSKANDLFSEIKSEQTSATYNAIEVTGTETSEAKQIKKMFEFDMLWRGKNELQ